LDYVYRFAVPELKYAVDASKNDEAVALLDFIISGQRLKDIADLSLELAR